MMSEKNNVDIPDIVGKAANEITSALKTLGGGDMGNSLNVVVDKTTTETRKQDAVGAASVAVIAGVGYYVWKRWGKPAFQKLKARRKKVRESDEPIE